ncbi:MAG: hypothetical protein V3V25_02535 [Paracoccaceae bacterium]
MTVRFKMGNSAAAMPVLRMAAIALTSMTLAANVANAQAEQMAKPQLEIVQNQNEFRSAINKFLYNFNKISIGGGRTFSRPRLVTKSYSPVPEKGLGDLSISSSNFSLPLSDLQTEVAGSPERDNDDVFNFNTSQPAEPLEQQPDLPVALVEAIETPAKDSDISKASLDF